MRRKVLGTMLILNTLHVPSNTAVQLDEIRPLQDGIESLQNCREEPAAIVAVEDAIEEGGISEQTVNLPEESYELLNVDIPAIVIVKNQVTEEFVKMIEEQAVTISYNYDLYPSVTIAQAILESQAGNSSLSIAPFYNLFGIKGNYKGATIAMKTQEDDGKGNLITIDAEFRQYPSYEESLEDYARLLKFGLANDPDFYKGAWKSTTNNYQEATAFLTGKYATDSQYAAKLNQLIEAYQLNRYDDCGANRTKKIEKDDDIVKKQAFIRNKNIHLLVNNQLSKRQAQLRNLVARMSSYLVKMLKFMRNYEV